MTSVMLIYLMFITKSTLPDFTGMYAYEKVTSVLFIESLSKYFLSEWIFSLVNCTTSSCDFRLSPKTRGSQTSYCSLPVTVCFCFVFGLSFLSEQLKAVPAQFSLQHLELQLAHDFPLILCSLCCLSALMFLKVHVYWFHTFCFFALNISYSTPEQSALSSDWALHVTGVDHVF